MIKSLKELMEKEKQAEKLKTEMISNISHDLRTPITSLLGYTELLKLHESKENQQEYIEIIQRKGKELNNLVADLLEYCSIDFKQVKFNKEKVEVMALVQQIIIDFIPQLEEAEMNFTTESVSPKLYVDADVGLLIRLFQNIINNSIMYGKTGKKISIQLLTDQENVLIKIANNGKEILPEDIPYLFERFYRAEKSRNDYTGGKGMGLAIAKSIAELHGGSISVTSNPKQTSFTISIPESKKTD
ncbi:HAMP domain-containing histidine kinase, partial [Gracilibacillus oryzae]